MPILRILDQFKSSHAAFLNSKFNSFDEFDAVAVAAGDDDDDGGRDDTVLVLLLFNR